MRDKVTLDDHIGQLCCSRKSVAIDDTKIEAKVIMMRERS